MFLPVMVALLSAEATNSFWYGWMVLAWVTMASFLAVLIVLVTFNMFITWQRGGVPSMRKNSLLSEVEAAEREAFLKARKKMAQEEQKIKSIYCSHEGSFIEDEEFSNVATETVN